MSSAVILQEEKSFSTTRILGWGASALVHGGVLAILLYGPTMTEAPRPSDTMVPLEMASIPVAPSVDEEQMEEVMEEAQVVAPEATNAAQVPPPPLATTVPEPVTASEPPPDVVQAAPPMEAAPPPPPEAVQAVQPEMQQAVEPDAVPLEAADIPPPPPAPPPPPVQARPPAPPPPRPAPRQETPRPAAPAATQQTQAPQAPMTAAPAPAAAPTAAPRRAAAAPSDYTGRILGALNRAKRYPNSARLRRITGTGSVAFTIMRDGSVAQWRLARSTGSEILDAAIDEMMQRVRIPPLPPEVEGESLSIEVPINFTLS